MEMAPRRSLHRLTRTGQREKKGKVLETGSSQAWSQRQKASVDEDSEVTLQQTSLLPGLRGRRRTPGEVGVSQK